MNRLIERILYRTNYTEFLNMDDSCITVRNDKIICSPVNLFYFRLDNNHWNEWQNILKISAFFNQSNVCLCKDRNIQEPFELHHALLTRADLRSVINKESILHHSYNVIVLHHNCHENIIRTQSYDFLANIYGIKNLQDWYLNVPLKIKPIILW